jgi:uncharacterized protein
MHFIDEACDSGLLKVVYAGLGWCAVALAFAGVFVPGLPVTVFVIAASWLFAKSSPRFEAWLLANRWFGPRLQRFRDTGGMPKSAKRAALLSMWTAIAISSLMLARISTVAMIATIALGGAGTLAILYAVRTTPEQN